MISPRLTHVLAASALATTLAGSIGRRKPWLCP